MSASNWAQCPKCNKIAANKKADLKIKVEAAYGQVTEHEYHRLLEQYGKRIEPESTLREDYEIGIWNGQFRISYSGRCEKCGFKKEFKITEPIEI